MNGIDAIQRQNIFRVNPINLFENRKENNRFNANLFRNETNSDYNLMHPQIFGSETQAKNLDLLA